MNQSYYTPAIPNPQTATVGEFRPIRTEESAIIQRVSRDIYANPASGMREIIANEIRAGMLAKESGASPRIEVIIMPDRIRIWGMDSLGIERKIFDEVFMCLGRSGNFDGTKPGQFGFGRAAYTTISDHILIETKHRNGDCYSVLGVEGRGYQVDIGTPDIPYGTRVTMAPKKGIRARELVKMVNDIASMTRIPITLTTTNGTSRPHYVERDNYAGIQCDTPDVWFSVTTSGVSSTDPKAFLCGIPISFNYDGKYKRQILKNDHKHTGRAQVSPDAGPGAVRGRHAYRDNTRHRCRD